jgi:hypothetical protein
MTPIEQSAKDYREFHGDSEAIEKAYREGAKQARLQDVEVLREQLKLLMVGEFDSFSRGFWNGVNDSVIWIEELL